MREFFQKNLLLPFFAQIQVRMSPSQAGSVEKIEAVDLGKNNFID